jgi:cytochrome c peroxidase
LLLTIAGCANQTAAVNEISPDEVLAGLDAHALILDVRTAKEFEAGHVPNAVNIPHSEVAARIGELGDDTDRPVVVYCQSGKRAGLASTVLLDAGYKNILHLTGDMQGWRAAEQPIERGAKLDVDKIRQQAKAIFGTLPANAHSAANPPSDEKVALGRMLYYDTRLSKNHDLSCNSCHLLSKFGQDSAATSPGHRGQLGGRNSPTVYNAALHFTQFWDGREPDVEAQAKGPVLNPIEMAMPSAEAVVNVLKSIPDYVSAFDGAFPGADASLTYDNMANAIGAFERGLITPAPFDAFLAGDDAAMTNDQVAGLQQFLVTGCIVCHMGPAIGGTMFQKLGLVAPYETSDTGRFEVTGKEADKYFFKVPSLRNIAETGPYFHDGSVKTLQDAVFIMAKHQLGKELSQDENASIINFLASLTGSIDPAYIAKPALPASGPTTPAADPN